MPYEEDALKELEKYNNLYRGKYTNNFVVEIGCSYNSWFLNESLNNLRGIRIDADIGKIINYGHSQFPFKSIYKKVSANNICNILAENNTPEDFFMFCIDIDGPDFFVMMSILKKYRPKVILTEFNENIPYPAKFTVKASEDFTWVGGRIYGYSIACIEDMMNLYGYRLDKAIVNNLFLTRIDDGEKPNTHQIEEFYNEGYVSNKKYTLDDESLFTNEYNKDIQYLLDKEKFKSKQDIADEFKKHLVANPINKYNSKNILANIDKCIYNDKYDKYLKDFLNEL